MAIQKKKLIPRISTQLQEIYGLDEAFSILVNQYSLSLRIAVENHQTLPEISFPEDWPLNKIILARRAILLNLSRMWSKENSDEPIHWRISDALLELAGCSFLTVNEALAKICLEAYSAKQDDLSSFFIKLNSDKTGNILDNLVLSQVTFQSLLDEGWQPDRWEIENLPMSINMFLEFLSLNGFTQVGNIGDILLIDLNNANSNYRYRGSPFLSSNDIKKVQVIVPGWEYMGELIIRQKVIELTVKEGQS